MVDYFGDRHLGISDLESKEMLDIVSVDSLDQLIDETVPANIRKEEDLNTPKALSEFQYLQHIKQLSQKNEIFRSYIGQGYYGTITPAVIRRNVFENPGWYTQYTPYQAEISQGRLEALLNFQTLVCDLTGLPIANASLLDEGTAAAEAMMLFYHVKAKKNKDITWEFLIENGVYEHTIDVVRTKAEGIGIKIVIADADDFVINERSLGVLLQYPDKDGAVVDYSGLTQRVELAGVPVAVAADLMSLLIFKEPSKWGADVVLGNTQRFGVPLGFGGPHAAYFSCKEDYKRVIPGRIIGVSHDRMGNPALRMALQTREQHIRRAKATSNICTAQALLAIMASMYAVYHGPDKLKSIAQLIHANAVRLSISLSEKYSLKNKEFFDTLSIKVSENQLIDIKKKALHKKINLFYSTDYINISLDETVQESDLEELCEVFGVELSMDSTHVIPDPIKRSTDYLIHPIFNTHHTETRMMRYIKSLENKDLSLVHGMIPLGSCTMKLNAAVQLEPVSWPAFSSIHPFVPDDQVIGYLEMIHNLEAYLCEITGFTACSLMPNSGAQGEYAGLLAIRKYHESRGDYNRNIVLIPSSAHGTNPASAIVSGQKVVVVKCDEAGNIMLSDLEEKAIKHGSELAALMVTYPSTHGVFESQIVEICDLIHAHGGMIYMDGANMNAQVGLTNPGAIHADVCHLNLHKTFSIPHGGGGPGMGPICVNDTLKPFLPTHIYTAQNDQRVGAVASSAYSSASILLISYAYIRLLGPEGLKRCSEIAILNANYIKARLESHYPVLFVGENGRVAHELIIDMRPFKAMGIQAEDVAKRLIDYGFHAPTLSFPVAGTLMIEPTESEDKDEMDRFIQAMISIKSEIDEIASGNYDQDNNVLVHAPHTLEMVTADLWEYPYSREKAAYPVSSLKNGSKFWSSVARVDNAYGDRNLVCTCPPMEAYEEFNP